ncbi:HlyD family type I secretion periplasmic adaptor subunit [Rhodoblastus sp.]|uniref:HlyD family type I secretion periplasmic adaptor subunit n=1 Tax=Rhodoblastus sp. TaxID=1962975 RepID=UPI003F9854DE
MSEVREAPPPAQKLREVARKLQPHLSDREFLPADLEILETPPSPVRMALILLIGALVVSTLVWSWFGRLDIIAAAQGKIQPAGRVKVIQPLDTGRVAAIHVENGQHVKAGDLLIEMDAGDARSEQATAQSAYDAYSAEAMRRAAAVKAAQARELSPPPTIDWRPETPLAIRQREELVLSGDLAQLADAVASYDAQIRQKEIERDRLTATMESQSRLIATLQERVDMRSSLAKSGSGAKAAVIDAEETLQYHETQLATQQGQRDGAIANLDVLARDRDKTFSNFVAENGQKLDEAQRQADDSREKLVKAKLKSERMDLRAPIDGTIYGLSVTTIGQVAGGGDELMRIVPEGAVLEIESYLANKDVGFVKPGQTAVVKIESFPFTRYGTLTATVERVASDAIPEPDAQQTESDAARKQSEKTFAGAQRTQNLVFPVTLKLARTVMNIDGQSVPLTPGMAVSVEIATGSRRILEYVFSPLVQTASQAMKER